MNKDDCEECMRAEFGEGMPGGDHQRYGSILNTYTEETVLLDKGFSVLRKS